MQTKARSQSDGCSLRIERGECSKDGKYRCGKSEICESEMGLMLFPSSFSPERSEKGR